MWKVLWGFDCKRHQEFMLGITKILSSLAANLSFYFHGGEVGGLPGAFAGPYPTHREL
jgi:hypothetical protein